MNGDTAPGNEAGTGTGTAADKDLALFATIRDEMWALLSARYRVAGNAVSDAHERPFWPEFTFDSVRHAVEDGRDLLLVTFHETDRPERTLGFRVDVRKAMAEWSKRLGGRRPHEHPQMFAAEVIWYMVCFIGVADLGGDAPGTPEAPYWINEGGEVFGRLKNNPNMDAFESHR